MTPLALLARKGGGLYGGEAVSQLAHALQSAELARLEGASEALRLAALLHDVGHLLNPASEQATRVGLDLEHEELGARYLARFYGPEVVEPVRLHVQAKRSLARAPAYAAALSEESRRSLRLQGGPFDDEQDAAFRALPFAGQALDLRRWDDLAKDPTSRPPGLESFSGLHERCANR